MRELLKKAGSLALGLAALGLVLTNAALNHGCAGSRAAAPVTQAPPPAQAGAGEPRVSESPTPKAPAEAQAAEANPECEERRYMPATKAPVWVPPKCRGQQVP